jgi:hypothetical protein
MSNEVQVQQISSIAEIDAMQLDQQITTAKKYPRDEMRSVAKSIQLATYNVKTAQSCIYFRPVGKKDGKQTFAEGPSIRLAEVLKSSWGNIRCGTRVSGERDGMIFVQAVCHDLENNVFETSEVGKSVVGRSGSRYPESMIQVVIGAASKIALRNVIFSVVPKVYAEQIMDACKKEICGSEEEKAGILAALIESFGSMGVDEAALFDVVDRKLYPVGSNDELVFLIGLHNAIKDGLCSVEETFGVKSKSSKPEVTPDMVKETVAPKAQPPKQSAKAAPKKEEPKKVETVPPTVSDAADFENAVFTLTMATGMTAQEVDALIEREFFVKGGVKAVPADVQAGVIERLQELEQQAGA